MQSEMYVNLWIISGAMFSAHEYDAYVFQTEVHAFSLVQESYMVT